MSFFIIFFLKVKLLRGLAKAPFEGAAHSKRGAVRKEPRLFCWGLGGLPL
jgi:hypothetical protein